MRSLVTENVVGVSKLDKTKFKNINYDDIEIVNSLVQEALISAGLGKHNPNIPLMDIIKSGMSVLIKPNWVSHFNKSGVGMDSLVTHPNFIEAVLLEVFKCKPSKVIIGDAPIQGCNLSDIVKSEWIKKVRNKAPCQVEIIDFRRTIITHYGNDLSKGIKHNVRDLDEYIIFDLGNKSRLEPISSPTGRFRVTMYDPRLLAEKHKPGKHQYLISKVPFESDVILNLPKLKTHQKGGITGALKNLVGVNGNKDYLPHHRIGGKNFGGDCYQGYALDKRVAEFFFDMANKSINKKRYKIFSFIAQSIVHTRKNLGINHEITGGWYGNDTVWRMTLDLNSLLLYGKKDGTISDEPVRRVYSITDAIIAGDTNGPLEVEEIRLGVVTFASSSAFADLVHTYLMKFDWQKIPTVREAFNNVYFKLVTQNQSDCKVFLNKKFVTLDELTSRIGISFRPAPGWVGKIEM